MTTRKQRLNLGQVNGLIKDLLRDHPQPSEIVLLAFAEQINGKGGQWRRRWARCGQSLQNSSAHAQHEVKDVEVVTEIDVVVS